MKGVSPVVATVLLIAIAVIAAIGVWYWVGAYTGKPAVGVSQNAFSIESCKITNTTYASVLVRNTGALTLDKAADVMFANGSEAGAIELNVTNLDAGAIDYIVFNGTGLVTGVYNIVDADYPSYQFTCN